VPPQNLKTLRNVSKDLGQSPYPNLCKDTHIHSCWSKWSWIQHVPRDRTALLWPAAVSCTGLEFLNHHVC